jgi:hypothetical protein
MPPVYKSTATILFETEDIPPTFIIPTVIINEEKQLEILKQKILTSTRLIEIINQFGLFNRYRKKMSPEELVGIMRMNIKLIPVVMKKSDLPLPMFDKSGSSIISFSLSFEGTEQPQTIQKVVNNLTSLFMEESSRSREQKASEVYQFLEDEAKRVKEDLDVINEKLGNFKKDNPMTLPEVLQVNMTMLNNLSNQRDILTERTSALREKKESLEVQLSGLSPESQDIDIARLRNLRLEYIRLKEQYSDDYPDVKNIKSEISKLEEKVSQEKGKSKSNPSNPSYVTLSSQLASVDVEIKAQNAQINDIEKKISEYTQRIEKTHDLDADYKSLTADWTNTQGKYNSLIQKAMEAKLSERVEKTQKGEKLTLVEPAHLPTKPIKPNRKAILLISFILAVSAGVAAVVFSEITDPFVHGPEDLESLGDFTVLSSISVVREQATGKLSKKKMIKILISVFISLVIFLTIVHFAWIPIDVIFHKLILRFGMFV